MKRLIILAVACAVAPLAGAELYKYVDKDGKTVYSDQPPPKGEAKTLHIAPPPPPAAKGESFVERDKALQKGREKEAAKEKEEQRKAEEAKAKQLRCEQAREAYRTYDQGGRILQYKNGEREYMSDDEIAAARTKAKKEMDEACEK